MLVGRGLTGTMTARVESEKGGGRISQKYFGKYRGTVTDNRDPLEMGRIRVQVPAVSGLTGSTLAMPCAPVNLGKTRASSLPKVGANVWIEFEAGDPDHPIWSGCFYSNQSETPAALKPK